MHYFHLSFLPVLEELFTEQASLLKCLTIYSHKTHHDSFSKKESSNPLKAPPVNITTPLTKVVVKKQKYFGTG